VTCLVGIANSRPSEIGHRLPANRRLFGSLRRGRRVDDSAPPLQRLRIPLHRAPPQRIGSCVSPALRCRGWFGAAVDIVRADYAELNFQISVVIYILLCIPLMFIVIGIPLAIAIGVGELVFTIIAAIKANDGQYYRYPLTIRFL
jgi:hypothetical protein